MKRTRKNNKGRYAITWWNHFKPLLFLISFTVLMWLIQQYFKQEELKSPCEPECKFNFQVRAYEEVAVTNAGQTASHKTQKEQIIEYITKVFGEDAPDAFNILYCENRGLRPDAINHNRNGSIDEGIFQINSIHGQKDMQDWKKNIDFAYKLFKRGGWSAWSCSERIGITPFWKK